MFSRHGLLPLIKRKEKGISSAGLWAAGCTLIIIAIVDLPTKDNGIQTDTDQGVSFAPKHFSIANPVKFTCGEWSRSKLPFPLHGKGKDIRNEMYNLLSVPATKTQWFFSSLSEKWNYTIVCNSGLGVWVVVDMNVSETDRGTVACVAKIY